MACPPCSSAPTSNPRRRRGRCAPSRQRGGCNTILHLDNCPYCRKARQALDELQAENAAYRGVTVEWIEEQRQSDAAGRYTDYYYVPTIYAGDRKLYEPQPGDDYETIKAAVKKALEAVL